MSMQEFDVVVLGTGAAGLTAAIRAHDGGARVGVFEKGDKLGGTSAWSGGMIWIPNNHHMAEIGVSDSAEDAMTYIMSLSHGMIEEELAQAFVDTGPEMVRWMEEHTPVQFRIVEGFPDYHPEFPCGKTEGGRSMECPLFSFRELGAWGDRITRSYFFTLPLTMAESTIGGGVYGGVPAEEIERRQAAGEWGCGHSLIGRLLKGCLDRGIEPVTGARAVELVMEDGRVAGVRFEGADGPFQVRSRGGVVLATGGFEWNPEMVKSFLRGPMTSPVSIPTNTGDGLKMSMKAGASLGNMREAWWMPAVEIPGDRGDGRPFQYIFQGERARPGAIMVNRKGRRFTNEAANYNAFGAAFHVQDVTHFEYVNLPCWSICDQACIDTYGFIRTTPGEPVLDFVTRADSLAELAGKLGIPADALEETVARWNASVEAGGDPDFGRGDSAQDNWWGDATKRGLKEATLGKLTKPPFYAVEVASGSLGTKGGPKTDTQARVLDLDGAPIPGLYAAGNVMASAMGMTYGGAGGTLGPGMVFGYLAGRHAAERTATLVNR
ncbi:MAG: FAD-dependent oxidoreductase [Alphaproteobacteria bacterium]|nr:FAD-dependent oxidoreductase [Alphaproteobacteria bacterium]